MCVNGYVARKFHNLCFVWFYGFEGILIGLECFGPRISGRCYGLVISNMKGVYGNMIENLGINS
jgi:hypothetical protein